MFMTKAYEAYSNDVDTDERMTMGEFKIAVHEYDKETFKSTPLAKKYAQGLVYSDTTRITMIDPSVWTLFSMRIKIWVVLIGHLKNAYSRI
jgi:hypothetical protein